MVICYENEVMLEKYIVKQVQEESIIKPIISQKNINRLKIIQEIIFLEEGKTLSFDEAIGLVLTCFERSIHIKS